MRHENFIFAIILNASDIKMDHNLEITEIEDRILNLQTQEQDSG